MRVRARDPGDGRSSRKSDYNMSFTLSNLGDLLRARWRETKRATGARPVLRGAAASSWRWDVAVRGARPCQVQPELGGGRGGAADAIGSRFHCRSSSVPGRVVRGADADGLAEAPADDKDVDFVAVRRWRADSSVEGGCPTRRSRPRRFARCRARVIAAVREA
jgi:hypothetical protein